MPRAWVWLQLLIGWLPVWALFTTLIFAAHRTPLHLAALLALRMMLTAAILGFVVQRLTRRLPWPHPFRPSFVLVHLVAAGLYGCSWILLNSIYESLVRGRLALAVGVGITPFLVLGVWLYVMVAGVSYAARATERAARAEALAARSQLAALRGQLNPHFLFNALHTVVQLIPRQPERAVRATEEIAALLRSTIDADRDLVSLREERSFVERYLDLERLRFGDRLRVDLRIPREVEDAAVPSFSLLTLVENAVRHGAAPRVEATEVVVAAHREGEQLIVTVRDDGAGADADAPASGTGLQRLRDRLAALYDERAGFEIATAPGRGFTATLRVPFEPSPE